MQPAQLYDSAATMFSPDGRIYQVEYAREAVKRGTTAVGVAFPDGVALLVDKRVGTRLAEPHQIEKIYKVDSHIGAASSGLVGDARILVARARVVAQQYRVTYGEPVEITNLVKDLSDVQQAYTQNGGVRPFGAAFLIGGIDPNGQPRLYETDPSGAVVAYKASAIGVGRAGALEHLETNYKAAELDLEKAIQLGVQTLLRSAGAESTPGGQANLADIAVVSKAKGYYRLTPEEVAGYLGRGR